MLHVARIRNSRLPRDSCPRSRLTPKRIVRAGIVLQMRFYRDIERNSPFIRIKTRASALSSMAITNRDIDKNT